MNPHEVLQLSPGASREEAKAAYHRLAKTWHPDKFSGDEKQAAEDKFRRILEAYATIKKGVATAQKADLATRTLRAESPKKEKTPQDWVAEAQNGLYAKQYDTALSLSQYCFRYPEVAEEARLIHAWALEALGRDKKAQARAFEEVLRINPENTEALVKLSGLFHDLGMPAKASAMGAKARALGAYPCPAGAQATLKGTKTLFQENMGIINKVIGFIRRT